MDTRIDDFMEKCRSALDGMLNTNAQLTKEYAALCNELEQETAPEREAWARQKTAPAKQKADAVGSEMLDELLGKAQELIARRMVEFLNTEDNGLASPGFSFDYYDLNTVNFGLANIIAIGELRGRIREGGEADAEHCD